MAAKKPAEPKPILEREYIVPLRKEWLKVPEYKRANKATKALKQFIAKHMKVYDRDLKKIKIDQILNNEIRFRGMKKPPAKIKVKAIKLDNGIVRVELVDLPPHIKFAKLREEKIKAALDKKTKAKQEEKKALAPPGVPSEEGKEKPEEAAPKGVPSKEDKEKQAASKEETLKIAKEQAKEMKHVSKEQKVQKQVQTQRKALAK
jgi:large subunit ribosomal protein L31e|tara:strand:- start:44 stop:655 length:612 start_codon:yes stop_codon:yes gene_type:complete